MPLPSKRSRFKITPARIALGVGVTIIAGIVIAYVGADMSNSAARDKADQAAYGVSGPPCPTTTLAELAAIGPALQHNFEYGDLQISHAFGEADCAEIAGKGGLFGIGAPRVPICRFTSPGSLEVRDGQADLLFRPGLGQPAAILKQDGKVKCVMAAKEMGS
jgi:hypothetical protein